MNKIVNQPAIVDALPQNDQSTLNVPATKKRFGAWVKKNKKPLIVICLSLLGVAIGVAKKEQLAELWRDIIDSYKRGNIYSTKWFANATDELLSEERERIRLLYCSAGVTPEANVLEKLLSRFDKEMSRRSWGDATPHSPSIHREHGWYLPNDD